MEMYNDGFNKLDVNSSSMEGDDQDGKSRSDPLTCYLAAVGLLEKLKLALHLEGMPLRSVPSLDPCNRTNTFRDTYRVPL